MAGALPPNQNRIQNQTELGTVSVALPTTIEDRNEEAYLESAGDQRPFGYGPCYVCNTNKICILFINCKHLVCCNRCSNECIACPKCGQRVIERLRVFEPN